MARKRFKSRRRDSLRALPFLLPSLSGIAVMFLLPTLDVVRRSFLSPMGDAFTGLQNYAQVLANPSFRLALGNTGRFLAACIPLLLALSLATAVALCGQRRAQSVLRTTYLLPLVVPVSSAVLLIRTIFHQNGLLSALCLALGLPAFPWLESGWALGVLVLCYLWKNLGYNVVLWMAGLSAIPTPLYEAAWVDGARPGQCFFHITLPLLRPTLFMTAVLALINSFKVFREAYLVAGQYPHDSIYMLQHVLNNWFGRLDMQKISAAAVLMMGAVMLLAAIFQRLSGAAKEENA